VTQYFHSSPQKIPRFNKKVPKLQYPSAGRRHACKGPHVARGPRVWHSCIWQRKTTNEQSTASVKISGTHWKCIEHLVQWWSNALLAWLPKKV